MIIVILSLNNQREIIQRLGQRADRNKSPCSKRRAAAHIFNANLLADAEPVASYSFAGAQRHLYVDICTDSELDAQLVMHRLTLKKEPSQ